MSTALPAFSATAAASSNHTVPGCSVQSATDRFSCPALGWASDIVSGMYSWGTNRYATPSSRRGKWSTARSVATPARASAPSRAASSSSKNTFCPLADTMHTRFIGWRC